MSRRRSYTEVAVTVLSRAQKPLTASEVWERARKAGLTKALARGRGVAKAKVSFAAKMRQLKNEADVYLSVQVEGVNHYVLND